MSIMGSIEHVLALDGPDGRDVSGPDFGTVPAGNGLQGMKASFLPLPIFSFSIRRLIRTLASGKHFFEIRSDSRCLCSNCCTTPKNSAARPEYCPDTPPKEKGPNTSKPFTLKYEVSVCLVFAGNYSFDRP